MSPNDFAEIPDPPLRSAAHGNPNTRGLDESARMRSSGAWDDLRRTRTVSRMPAIAREPPNLVSERSSPMKLDSLNPDADLMVETDPRPEDVRFLREHLNEFNAAATGITDGNFLALFKRAADGSAVAGVFGWTWGETCYLRYLFVSQNMRGQGHGTRLMRAVETEAKCRGCQQIVLETHDFQAPRFYQKLGFTIIGRVENYPRGHQFLMLVKQLV
jgi:ribosomal protein S18 acetylase RimI-like enzyme